LEARYQILTVVVVVVVVVVSLENVDTFGGVYVVFGRLPIRRRRRHLLFVSPPFRFFFHRRHRHVTVKKRTRFVTVLIHTIRLKRSGIGTKNTLRIGLQFTLHFHNRNHHTRPQRTTMTLVVATPLPSSSSSSPAVGGIDKLLIRKRVDLPLIIHTIHT